MYIIIIIILFIIFIYLFIYLFIIKKKFTLKRIIHILHILFANAIVL